MFASSLTYRETLRKHVAAFSVNTGLQVALEKRMREAAKQHAQEKQERARERAQAAKRERLHQLELLKAKEQIQAQIAALATHRQRERK